MKKISPSEFSLSFSRSSGSGGQNVNKVNTKVTLSWAIKDSKVCSKEVAKRFIEKYQRFMTGDNVIIRSQRYRSQNQNINDCINKLNDYLTSVEYAQKTRRATKPTKGSIRKRLENKKIRSISKKLRSEKF